MRLYDAQGQEHIARAVKEPKFTAQRGRTWDKAQATIDGQPVEMWLDWTWGRNFYYRWRGRWYALPLEGNHDLAASYRKAFTSTALTPEGGDNMEDITGIDERLADAISYLQWAQSARKDGNNTQAVEFLQAAQQEITAALEEPQD